MIALLLRSTLLLTALFALPIFLIRAQPYDDSELRAFLTPPAGCPAPCFMGIRPRITPIAEALLLLREHDWVKSLNDEYIDLDSTMRYPAHLHWEWSGKQPALIEQDGNRELWVFSRDIISVDVDTQIAVGDLKLALGEPDNEKTDYYTGESGCTFAYGAWYQQLELTIVATGTCPLGDIYRNRVSLRWMKEG